jgi:hypothetical protein
MVYYVFVLANIFHAFFFVIFSKKIILQWWKASIQIWDGQFLEESNHMSKEKNGEQDH